MSKNRGRYSDIIDLPHHQSIYRPHMTIYNRAAQFAPFAALTGYDQMVQDTADIRQMNKKIILDEDRKYVLERKLQSILNIMNNDLEVEVTYFAEAENKCGGEYVIYSGKIKRIDEVFGRIVFKEGKIIDIRDIIELNETVLQKGIE